MVSHNTIHDPLLEKQKDINKYAQDPESHAQENHPVIAAMIERLDRSCGQIFDKVDSLGIQDDTVIVFFSDNGGKHSYAQQTPLRAGKGWLYEGGIRVPLIVKWSGVVDGGRVSDQLVISNDLFNTFLEIASVPTSEDTDGHSFLPQLRGEKSTVNRSLFWHYPHYHHGSGMVPAGAVRDGDYKLIELVRGELARRR